MHYVPRGWAHESCTNVEEGDVIFIRGFCLKNEMLVLCAS